MTSGELTEEMIKNYLEHHFEPIGTPSYLKFSSGCLRDGQADEFRKRTCGLAMENKKTFSTANPH